MGDRRGVQERTPQGYGALWNLQDGMWVVGTGLGVFPGTHLLPCLGEN